MDASGPETDPGALPHMLAPTKDGRTAWVRLRDADALARLDLDRPARPRAGIEGAAGGPWSRRPLEPDVILSVTADETGAREFGSG